MVHFSVVQADGAQVEVAFDTNAETDTLHYFTLYWDTLSRQSDHNYAEAIQIDARDCLAISGTSVSCTFDLPLQAGVTYHFSLRNFYFDAEPSGFANEFVLSYLPAAGPEALIDVDQDGNIDGIDLAAFAAQSATGASTSPALAAFASMFGQEKGLVLVDSDVDADIDGLDLAVFSQQAASNSTPLAVWDFAALFGTGE